MTVTKNRENLAISNFLNSKSNGAVDGGYTNSYQDNFNSKTISTNNVY